MELWFGGQLTKTKGVIEISKNSRYQNIFYGAVVGYYDKYSKFHNSVNCYDSTFMIQSLLHLDNCTNDSDCMPLQQGEIEMATKINRTVMINGEQRWIHANTEQEYVDKLSNLLNATTKNKAKHNFTDYSWNWYNTYSLPNVETVTAATYKIQLTRHLIPFFEGLAVEDIKTDDVQRLFNGMSGSKATKQKAKQVLNMIMDAALEDGLIDKNPLKSNRLKITGASSKVTDTYTVEQMQYLVSHLDFIKKTTDRVYLAIQALHPLRLEEVLGLKWKDVDTDNMKLHIRRAVTHPTRNQPEIKRLKTEASKRDIGLSNIAVNHLVQGDPDDFILGGRKPLSYQQVRRMCQRIEKDIGFTDKITPIRFRTTVLTDIYAKSHDIKLAQYAAGHTTSAMTLKHYVKGREDTSTTATVIDHIYGSKPESNLQSICTA